MAVRVGNGGAGAVGRGVGLYVFMRTDAELFDGYPSAPALFVL